MRRIQCSHEEFSCHIDSFDYTVLTGLDPIAQSIEITPRLLVVLLGIETGFPATPPQFHVAALDEHPTEAAVNAAAAAISRRYTVCQKCNSSITRRFVVCTPKAGVAVVGLCAKGHHPTLTEDTGPVREFMKANSTFAGAALDDEFVAVDWDIFCRTALPPTVVTRPLRSLVAAFLPPTCAAPAGPTPLTLHVATTLRVGHAGDFLRAARLHSPAVPEDEDASSALPLERLCIGTRKAPAMENVSGDPVTFDQLRVLRVESDEPAVAALACPFPLAQLVQHFPALERVVVTPKTC